ncbi:DoxX family protein [Flavobacterium sedimenticola]|uniref:DoxX family protein n=1 Tax=Flavobacterium sedimenticola TaxID=3043286 RepID=A0ABT6XS82_9FLAO|nr:hypothetical protein [Flavobacterium sedimenticola]MDI9257911.1 hypothetical protein [Flavobacterium sedimenticola]
MKPLFVLLAVTLASLFIVKFFTQEYNFHLAAKIGMSAMLFFTAMGHFIYSKGMAMMIPPVIPGKTEIVYATGVLEIILGIFLLIPKFSVTTGWIIILFFILILPANVYAAMSHINYQRATFDGQGINYLWFRIPLQILFIVWVYISAIKVSYETI